MDGEGQETAVQEADGALPELTETAFSLLKASGRWMYFIGIVDLVLCGIALVSGLVMLVFGANTPFLPEGPRMDGLFCIVFAVICFFPVMFIFLAGSKLRALKTDGDTDLLEEALRNNKAYWKFTGISTIVSLGLTALTLIILIIALLFIGIG
jgi:hypothetical protein